jgi:hypothetical protein
MKIIVALIIFGMSAAGNSAAAEGVRDRRPKALTDHGAYVVQVGLEISAFPNSTEASQLRRPSGREARRMQNRDARAANSYVVPKGLEPALANFPPEYLSDVAGYLYLYSRAGTSAKAGQCRGRITQN